MRDTLIKRKINVFISSNINEHLCIVRKALYDLLMETGICFVYEFDQEPGSTCSVVDSYSSELSSSDLVIVLINNTEPIGIGTAREIADAKKLNKKTIYIFCTENQNEPSVLQRELYANNSSPKCVTVDKLSNMAYEAYRSAICDIATMYQNYCHDLLEYKNIDDTQLEKSDLSYKNDIVYSRNALNGHDSEKITLQKELGIYWTDKTPDVEASVTATFLKYFIGSSEIENIDFKSLKDAIFKQSKRKFKVIVSLRLDALIEYCHGNLNETEKKIHQCIELCNTDQKYPEWLKNDVANAFSVALSFGSITNVLIIRRRLYRFLISECLESMNHRFFCIALKEFILDGNDKTLNEFWITYGRAAESITSNDAEIMYSVARKITNDYRRLNAYINILSLFGYYFDDFSFQNFYNELYYQFSKSLEDNKWEQYTVRKMITAVKNCCKRLSDAQILDVYFSIHNGNSFFGIDQSFELLNIINLGNLSKRNKEHIIGSIKKALNKSDIVNSSVALRNAIIYFVKQDKTNGIKLIDLIQSKMPEFYSGDFSMEMDISENKNIWKHIHNCLKDIYSQNSIQGVDEKYIRYSYNPYCLVAEILNSTNYKLKSSQMIQIINAVKNTLESTLQTYDAKCDAISMLYFAGIKSPKSQQLRTFIKYLEEDFDRVCTGHEDFFKNGYGPSLLLMEYAFLKCLSNGTGIEELLFGLTHISQSDTATQINATHSIYVYLNKIETTKLPITIAESLTQFLISESYHSHRMVRYHAMTAVFELTDTRFSDIIIARLSNMMDTETYHNKIGILSRISSLQSSNQAEYIIQKGLVDNNYWVREIAEEHKANSPESERHVKENQHRSTSLQR